MTAGTIAGMTEGMTGRTAFQTESADEPGGGAGVIQRFLEFGVQGLGEGL